MKKPRKLKKAERNVADAEKQLEKVVARLLRTQAAKQKARNKKRAKRDRKLADVMATPTQKVAKASPRSSAGQSSKATASKQTAAKATAAAETVASSKALPTASSTVAELRDVAKAKGVAGYSRMTKTQLLDALH